ncbi:MAG: 16S rRNA (cytosine(1402)-N(4))-methyltransferase RsmH [Phycisphaerales bacterium]
MSSKFSHIPVLAQQVVDLLQPQSGQVFVDCTAGLGGHSAMVGALVGPTGTVVLNDMDEGNLDRAQQPVRQAMNPDDPDSANVIAIRGNFSELPHQLADRGIVADMVLADLGFASTQVDDPSRGLSFRHSGPLDMRMDRSTPIDAGELVNTLPVRELGDLIKQFGEERHARRIASKIVEARALAPITTTDQLAELVRSAVPGPRSPIHPATRTFQALRIVVNDELGSLDSLLRSVSIGAKKVCSGEQGWLNAGARIAIIAFHSLEDRPVKQSFARMNENGYAELITRKPVGAEDDEIGNNPRSRSAKLRVARVLGPTIG